MYKKLVLVAIAASFITACSNDEVFENSNNTNNAIDFDIYVGKQTRASQTTIGNLNSFGVYAYVTASTPFQLMENEEISKTQEGKWVYNNIKYWPENDKVDFFAYAPYQAGWIDYSSSDKSFTYTVSALANAQEDLIAATAFQEDKNSNANQVNLVFKHLLSKIGFRAKSDKDYAPATVTVTGLKIIYKADAIDSASKFTFAGSGDSGTNEAGTWAITASAQFAEGTTSGELITNNVTMTTVEQSLNTFTAPDTPPDTYLMLLPQSVADGDIQAEITYTVTYTNPAAVVTNVKTINLPAVNWEMGKAYTYNFTIGLSQIIFDGISVSNWEDDTTQPAPTPVP